MVSTSTQNPLFQPWKVGTMQLKHRIVMAPLTRLRATQPNEDPNDLMAEYYEQRASDGGLIISEATYIAYEAGGNAGAPGCYTDNHVRYWKTVTDKVHAKGGKIYLQAWALGRANKGKGDVQVVSSGNIPVAEGEVTPVSLTKDDIQRYQDHYVNSAKKAIAAGFDGVELHGAHGYLIDQFIQATANNRTDEYGGSISNRTRFALEVISKVADAIGQDKVAIRLSPFSTFQGMYEPDRVAVFDHLVGQIAERFPKLAYMHMVEARADPGKLAAWAKESVEVDGTETLDRWRNMLKETETEFMSAGGYTPEIAEEVVAHKQGGVVFGRHFISNPDLPYRIKNGLALTPYDRSTFYTNDKVGYTTYENWSQPGTPRNGANL